MNISLSNKILLLMLLPLAFMLSGCPEENPLLVNPVSQAETVWIRYVNLSGNNAARNLKMQEMQEENTSENVAYSSSSMAFHPPADSVNAYVLNSGNVEFAAARKYKFARSLKYTFISLPTAPQDTTSYRVSDTLVSFSTSLTIPEITNDAFIRAFNAVPDSTTYSIKLGCPNGDAVASFVQYRKSSPAINVLSGSTTFSIVKHRTGFADQAIGLYSANFINRGEYTIIINRENGIEEIYLLDENELSNASLKKLNKLQESETFLRVANLSNSTKTVRKRTDTLGGFETVANDLPNATLSQFSTLSACQSSMQDKLTVLNTQSDTTTFAFGSLAVSEKITYLILPNANNRDTSLIVNTAQTFENRLGKSLIRFVNGDKDFQELTLTFGARQVNEAGLVFKKDQIIAQGTDFASISTPVVVSPGVAPLLVFSDNMPIELIYSGLFSFDANKNYTIILTRDESGKAKLNIIEDEEASKPIQIAEDGVYTQIFNAVTDLDFLSFSFENENKVPTISNVELDYTKTIATVLAEGIHNFSVNNKTFTIKSNLGEQSLYILTGSKDNIDTINASQITPKVASNRFNRRFINASAEIPVINVSDSDDINVSPLFPNIAYKSSSNRENLSVIKRFSYFIFEPNQEKYLYRLDAVKHTYGKNYAMIFIGNSKDKGYQIFELLEY